MGNFETVEAILRRIRPEDVSCGLGETQTISAVSYTKVL